MANRSLNKATLIGNLTRDPELRYTPQGTAVCTFGLATNRSWTTEAGEKKDEVEFHRIVAWNKLAELCSQLLFKGRRVYIEGRLQTRTWTGQDGVQRQSTEIVAQDMMILDNRRAEEETSKDEEDLIPSEGIPTEIEAATPSEESKPKEEKVSEKKKVKKEEAVEEEKASEEIPF